MLLRVQHPSLRLGVFRTASRFTLSVGLVLSLLVATVGLEPEMASASSPTDEQRFVEMINDLRAKKGLAPLMVHPELTSGARSWTAHMAATAKLAHSPDMSTGLTARWSVLGENVGIHGVHDLGPLFQAFVDSPAHYQNLIDPRFNYVGVGVVVSSEGKLWTTHRFMAAPEPEPPATPETTVPEKTATPPTAPPKTSPPTTTPPKTTPPETSPPKTSPPTTVPSDAALPTSAPPTNPGPAPAPSAPPATTPPTTVEPTITADPTSDDPTDGDTDQEIVDMVIVDDPTAGPTEPDVPTVEQVLVELAEAGI